MSLPSWPASLPRPNRAGYQARRQDARLRLQSEAGPPAYRRRWSSTPRFVSMTVELTRAQKATFDRFHGEELSEGSLPFWMPDPTTDGWPLLTAEGAAVLTPGGAPLLLGARWLCLFGDEMPTETITGTRFSIAFSVAVMP